MASILEPYDIPLIVSAVNTGPAFKRLAIQPGETAFEFIERACRYRALLPVSDGVGGLVLTKPGSGKISVPLIYGQNILSGNASSDQRERFSLYVVKGQAEADNYTSVQETSEPEGRAKDDEITRYRPTVITADAQGYDLSLEQRAKWQAQFNKARSKPVSYDVQGWYADGALELWKPNALVKVEDPLFSLHREMLITSVSYKRSDSGTLTTLTLMLPEAFDVPAVVEPGKADSLGGVA